MTRSPAEVMVERGPELFGLTESMLQAICDFEPNTWYGTACPTKRAAAHKGHMVRMGLAKHDGEAPISHYCLTDLGEEVRAAALRARATHEAE